MDKDGYHGYDKIERPCPNCEYHKQQAQRWREEAYKQAGHPLPEREWVGLTYEEQRELYKKHEMDGWGHFYNAIEAKLKEKNGASS